ncbi:putative B3 domain-containing protein At5g66980 [Nicotiana tabacum]|uniref:B3 domain-containing protein At5g66980 n=1 Tax=Nicotiana tabacum TaxID=4097 RepID=A0AC58TDS3_TOBAC
MKKGGRGRPRKKQPLVSEEEDQRKLIISTSSYSSSLDRPEFFKLFDPHRSSHQLKLSKDFTRKFGETIKERTTIKDLCGHVWNVSVEKTEDGLLFIREGWEDFINYHYVKGGYFLIFRYEEDSSFTVKVLGSNGCKE